jgi:hypothetical protein
VKKILLIALAIVYVQSSGQNISSEVIDFKVLNAPKTLFDVNSRTFAVVVKSPYNLTKEDVIKQSKTDFQNDLANYDNVVAQSQVEYNEKLKDYDKELAQAKDKFLTESAEFKKLSLLERLALTDKGEKPTLRNPSKPTYYKPQPPIYREPNLSNYFIVDNNVLASQININGFTKGDPKLDIYIDMQAVNFQDNAGQTFGNQPTKLIVKENGVEKINKNFFDDYTFVSSSPTNNINKAAEEKKYLNKSISEINNFLNENYGFKNTIKQIELKSVKNKGDYNDLVKANIYVSTNLRKLQATPDATVNEIAFSNMKKGTDLWVEALKKVNYKDKKAIYNGKIAKMIYFNLIRLNLGLNNKTIAEKYLNELQENMVNLDLSYDEKSNLKDLEKEIYK